MVLRVSKSRRVSQSASQKRQPRPKSSRPSRVSSFLTRRIPTRRRTTVKDRNRRQSKSVAFKGKILSRPQLPSRSRPSLSKASVNKKSGIRIRPTSRVKSAPNTPEVSGFLASSTDRSSRKKGKSSVFTSRTSSRKKVNVNLPSKPSFKFTSIRGGATPNKPVAGSRGENFNIPRPEQFGAVRTPEGNFAIPTGSVPKNNVALPNTPESTSGGGSPSLGGQNSIDNFFGSLENFFGDLVSGFGGNARPESSQQQASDSQSLSLEFAPVSLPAIEGIDELAPQFDPITGLAGGGDGSDDQDGNGLLDRLTKNPENLALGAVGTIALILGLK